MISGLSGTGKSTVCGELRNRGYNAVEADEELAYFADPETGLPANKKTSHWLWDKEKFNITVKQKRDDILFVCGGATNEEEFKHHFDKIFSLHIDDTTLRHRLLTRTNNYYGKDPKELMQQLEWNKGTVKYSKERGRTVIDATKSVDEVVNEILQHTIHADNPAK